MKQLVFSLALAVIGIDTTLLTLWVLLSLPIDNHGMVVVGVLGRLPLELVIIVIPILVSPAIWAAGRLYLSEPICSHKK